MKRDQSLRGVPKGRRSNLRDCFGFAFGCCLAMTLMMTVCLAEEAQEAPVLPTVEGSPLLGDVHAPVQIIEFTDFECHFCGQVQPALQQTLKTYPTQVNLVFKNFPLSMHRHAHTAHLAAMCAHEQGKFWEYRNVLFQNQSALKRGDLLTYAKNLNLDSESFAKCLDEEKYTSKIEEDQNEGMRAGVMGTPTFFINGEAISGAVPFSTFQELIERKLAEKSGKEK